MENVLDITWSMNWTTVRSVLGTKVFSLMRDSDFSPDEYLDHFHDTGTERARTLD